MSAYFAESDDMEQSISVIINIETNSNEFPKSIDWLSTISSFTGFLAVPDYSFPPSRILSNTSWSDGIKLT